MKSLIHEIKSGKNTLPNNGDHGHRLHSLKKKNVHIKKNFLFTKKQNIPTLKKIFPVMPSYHKKKNKILPSYFASLLNTITRCSLSFRNDHHVHISFVTDILQFTRLKTKKLHVSFRHLITNTRVKKYTISTFPFNTLAAIPPSEILTNPLLSPPKNIMFIVFLQFL